ncbi:hypothetical protein GFV16_23810 [Bacillus megaterium]|uniref:CDI toxin immunity protein n=1 Tax=Priestia megaterium TaxID=1404 RepID=UPI0012933983|nr:hypothetical protein [Priestia megaterium]MQR88882.1 hypothetical protein [Priestia megaterium]
MTKVEHYIQTLGNTADLLTKKQTSIYFEKLSNTFPFLTIMQINWRKVLIKRSARHIEEIKKWLQEMNIKEHQVVLFWKRATKAVSVDLAQALLFFQQTADLTEEAFIYCPSVDYVIEYFKDGKMMIGLAAR